MCEHRLVYRYICPYYCTPLWRVHSGFEGLWRKSLVFFGLKEDVAERRKWAVWHTLGRSSHLQVCWSKVCLTLLLHNFLCRKNTFMGHTSLKWLFLGKKSPLFPKQKWNSRSCMAAQNYCTVWSTLFSGCFVCLWWLFTCMSDFQYYLFSNLEHIWEGKECKFNVNWVCSLLCFLTSLFSNVSVL